MPDPIQQVPPYSGSTTRAVSVKTATPDLFIDALEPTVPIDSMTDLVFESIGGHEIISTSRNDLVNGRNVSYQLISDLADINLEYNALTIIPVPGSVVEEFDKNSIRFNTHIVEQGQGTGPNGETVYVDDATGELIINVKNLASDERVEVEVFTNVTILGDTLYTIT